MGTKLKEHWESAEWMMESVFESAHCAGSFGSPGGPEVHAVCVCACVLACMQCAGHHQPTASEATKVVEKSQSLALREYLRPIRCRAQAHGRGVKCKRSTRPNSELYAWYEQRLVCQFFPGVARGSNIHSMNIGICRCVYCVLHKSFECSTDSYRRALH